MDPNTLNIIKGAAGAAGGDPVYVEDVFSTDLWKGNYDTTPAPIHINNGIDLSPSGEGGLVWTKSRTINANHHQLFDTERGAGSSLYSSLTSSPGTNPVFDSFNSNGFSLTAGTWGTDALNGDSNCDFASWTFRKAPGFFDVVEWTGNSTAGREIPHNLGSVPGMIVVKCTTHSENWVVWHRSILNTQALWLQSVDDVYNQSEGPINIWNSTTPTSTAFTVGDFDGTNGDSSHSYVAYVFAHDDQQFGEDGDESIIKCGTFTGNTTVNLGFEPQWILLKSTSTGHWDMHDSMRVWPSSGDAQRLRSNLLDVEDATSQIYPNATGFSTLIGSDTYIYVAIRRGPMKTPTDATEVFDDVAYQGTSAAHDVPISPSYADLVFYKRRASSVDNWGWTSRLQGNLAHLTSNGPPLQNSTAPGSNAEANRAAADALEYDRQSSFGLVGTSSGEVNVTPEDYISYAFKRAPGFFDIVCYTATSGNTQHVPHNLGVQPELMIFKSRGATNNWWVYHKDLGASKVIQLDKNVGAQTSATWLNNTVPAADGSVFTLGSDTGNDGGYANYGTTTYIAYLFASCPDVCSIGTYTSNGEPQNIDCGFSAGARFILIKRHDNNSDWYIFDAARGINPGNDPYLRLNRNDAEVTTLDCIDPYNPGFTVAGSGNSNALINYTGENFIYLAIA